MSRLTELGPAARRWPAADQIRCDGVQRTVDRGRWPTRPWWAGSSSGGGTRRT